MKPVYTDKGARLSPCGQYRYLLWRQWSAVQKTACFVMLNPSTADHEFDDNTIRKCVGFAQSWGCGALMVVNLHAYRTESPEVLKKASQPVGRENDHYVFAAALNSDPIVAAWGVDGKHWGRDQTVLTLLEKFDIMCLGTTKDGHPKHPLYLPKTTELIHFRRAKR